MFLPDVAVGEVGAVAEVAVAQFIFEEGDDSVLRFAFGAVYGHGGLFPPIDIFFYCSKNAAKAEISARSCGNSCEVSLTSFSSRFGSR